MTEENLRSGRKTKDHTKAPEADFLLLIDLAFEQGTVSLKVSSHRNALNIRRDMYAQRDHMRKHNNPKVHIVDALEIAVEYDRDQGEPPPADTQKNKEIRSNWPALLILRKRGETLSALLRENGIDFDNPTQARVLSNYEREDEPTAPIDPTASHRDDIMKSFLPPEELLKAAAPEAAQPPIVTQEPASPTPAAPAAPEAPQTPSEE